jgi:Nucleotide-diphospho-sugar transferase
VIATDADALWVNSPLQSCLSGVHADMLVSQGGANPEQSLRVFGSPVCMGFLYIRSSRKARALIADMVQALEAGTYGDKDDQKAFNLLLIGKDYYVNKANRQLTNELHYFQTKPGSAANATGELATIARLPWSCADRGNGPFPDSKCMHLF